MSRWTRADLRSQFARSIKAGWLAPFQDAARKYDFDAALMMALASRETNLRNIVGDGGHGYGLMQIDDRSFPDWCHSGIWRDAKAGITKGALVLHGKQEQIQSSEGKRLHVGNTTFVGKKIGDARDLLRITVAAYNSGLWAYYSYTKFSDPDRRTTGRDYSADVLGRRELFEEFLKE